MVRTFLMFLGFVFFIAFTSFGLQAPGLIGSRGIVPVRGVSPDDPRVGGSRRLLGHPEYLVAASRRRGSAGSVDRRRRVRPGGHFHALEADGPGALRRAVAFALFGGAGVSLVPVGHPAGGSGLPGYLRGYLGGPRVALPVAAVPADVLQRRGETGEPRHGMAQPHGAAVPLRDPAAADAAGVVLLAVADVVSQSLHGGRVSRGVRCAPALFRAAEDPAYRRRDHGGVAGSHPGDGQLHVLQHPDDRAGGVAVYRAGAGRAGPRAPGGLDRRGSVDRRGERDDQPPTAFDPPALPAGPRWCTPWRPSTS